MNMATNQTVSLFGVSSVTPSTCNLYNFNCHVYITKQLYKLKGLQRNHRIRTPVYPTAPNEHSLFCIIITSPSKQKQAAREEKAGAIRAAAAAVCRYTHTEQASERERRRPCPRPPSRRRCSCTTSPTRPAALTAYVITTTITLIRFAFRAHGNLTTTMRFVLCVFV